MPAGEDGALAWTALRRTAEYREAWATHAEDAGATAPAEPGPFRVRVQTVADMKAARFEMLAWEDPFAEEACAAGPTRSAAPARSAFSTGPSPAESPFAGVCRQMTGY